MKKEEYKIENPSHPYEGHERTYTQESNPRRQKWTRNEYACWSSGMNPIETMEQLHEHLQIAMQVELTTIPPYLCALYSIREGTNAMSTRLIQSVVMEEMLHMMMVANIINALGFRPMIDGSIVSKYPCPLIPDKVKSDKQVTTFAKEASEKALTVRLLKFSEEAIDIFIKIEKPARVLPLPNDAKFHSIGQFYAALLDAITKLEKDAQTKNETIFNGDRKKQITQNQYYGAGGNLVEVTDLASATRAIDEIVGQGEGIDEAIGDGDEGTFGDKIELAHFFRFNEIKHGRKYQNIDKPKLAPTGDRFDVDWNSAYPIKEDPKMDDYQSNANLKAKVLEFNKAYTGLLKVIDKACNGEQEVLMEKGIPIMIQLKYMAKELMKTPVGDSGLNATPTFEYTE